MADADLTTRVVARIDGMRSELVDVISRAVKIPSVNPKYPGQVYDEVVGGEGEVSKFFAEIYRGIGCEVDVWAIEPGRENAVGVLKGTGGGRSLIYNGHVDVVPTGDVAEWKTGDPFSGRIEPDRIWGRGSTDMKAGIAAQAFAARALAEEGIRLQGDLLLESVVGEEVMDHECGVTATVRRGYTADAAVVSEPSSPPSPLAVVPVSPGLYWFSVTVRGKMSHASMRGPTIRAGGYGDAVGVHAIDKGVYIFNAIRQLEEQWGQTKGHPLFGPGHFTIHPGVVQGGPTGVLVPFAISEFMTIEYCVWYHPEEDPADVRAEIETHVHRAAQLDPWLREHPPRLSWLLSWPGFETAWEHPLAAAMAAAHGAVHGTVVPAPSPATPNGFGAACDATFYTWEGIPAIVYGPGDLTIAHCRDESIDLDELVHGAQALALAAIDWCGLAG